MPEQKHVLFDTQLETEDEKHFVSACTIYSVFYLGTYGIQK